MVDRFSRIAFVGTVMMGPGMATTLDRGVREVAMYGRAKRSVKRGILDFKEVNVLQGTSRCLTLHVGAGLAVRM